MDEGNDVDLTNLGQTPENVAYKLTNSVSHDLPLALKECCLKPFWSRCLKRTHVVHGIENLTPGDIPSKQSFILPTYLGEGALEEGRLANPIISEEVFKILSDHSFQLVLVANPIPLIVLKHLISVPPSPHGRHTMEETGVPITTLNPFGSRFLILENLLLE